MNRPIVPALDRAAAGRQRHELEVERRRAHPGEPRRSTVTDRPTPRDDRRGAHGYSSKAC